MKKQYLILTAKALVFALCLVVMDFGVGGFYNWLRGYSLKRNPYAFEMKPYYLVEQTEADMIIVGASETSHAYIANVMADSLDLSVYNFGQDGSFFYAQNAFVRLVLQRYTPKYILWDVSDDCLSQNLSEEDLYKSTNALYPYYDDVFCRQLINHRDAYQKFRMLSEMYRYNSQFSKYLIPTLNSVKCSFGFQPIDSMGYEYPDFLTITGRDYPLAKNHVKVLEETLKLCRECGTQVIFISTPRYADPATLRDKECYKELFNMADEYEVPYLDFYTSIADSSAFKDVSHLNSKGARIYMDLLIPRLRMAVK